MKLLIALCFMILATIQLGLFIGVFRYFIAKGQVKPSPYWIGSLVASIGALFVFGIGVAVNSAGTKNPEFNFTIANTLFYVAGVLQFLFCRSLIKPISKRLNYFFLISVFIFIPIFEFMRVNATFEIRTSFMVVIASFFFTWQIIQLNQKRRADSSQQLLYLQFATAAELILALGRLGILIASGLTIREVEQLPQVLILFTIFQIVMNTLSYIAIGGYWTEKIALANAISERENKEIRNLLKEREGLISSLLKVNKTAATGALSASIAHELNQPLGAMNLNIQFLQKRLSEGALTPEQMREVLAALLSDNQRAANIIQSLRSIFSDGKIGVEHVDLNDLIQSVLKIANPDIHSKNIQVRLRLDSRSLVNISRNEIQQVVLNLINNAVQGLSEKPNANKTIQIESRDVTDGVEIVVRDNGLGIDAETQSHLFELLSATNKKAGMGLGLWLCRHIITRHGGRICYQDAPDGGAQFTFFLPLAQA